MISIWELQLIRMDISLMNKIYHKYTKSTYKYFTPSLKNPPTELSLLIVPLFTSPTLT